MTSSDPRRLAVALLAASIMTACSSATHPPRTAAQPASPAASTAPPSSSPDYDALARARMDSASRLYTPADVHFMSGMIGHHSQAITMARMAPTHGASSSVQTLASRIINAQRDEIATMQQWLRDRGLPVPDPSKSMAGMNMPGMAGGDHAGLMPGMLTPAQMAQLDSARGPAFDRLFLTDMIQHHTGAVTMVKALFDSYGAGQDETVFKFASDVNVDQTTEIARMQRMLVALAFAHPSQQ